MLKKILIAVGILALLGIIGIVFVGNKIDNKLKEKEPEFRQYTTMTVEDQNAYVEKHFNEFFALAASMNEKDEQLKAAIEQFKNDPEALQAGIAMGRSMVAELILQNENILKDLSAEVHNKLQSEAAEADSRAKNFEVYMNKYFPKDK